MNVIQITWKTCLLAWLSCQVCMGGTVTLVEGVIEYSNTYPEASVDPPEEPILPFQIAFDGCRWNIHLARQNGLLDYVEVSFDGKRMYYVEGFETAVNKRRANGESNVGSNVGAAQIFERPIPYFPYEHRLGPIWLTFLSGCFFSELRTDVMDTPGKLGVVPPTGGDRRAASPFLQKIQMEKAIPNACGVPNRVTFSHKVASTEQVHNVLRSSLGLTNSVFNINSWTQRNSKTFPSEAIFTTYFLRDFSGRKEIFQHAYKINLTSVSTQSGTVELPQLPGITFMTDERFLKARDKVWVQYTTNKWLSDQEVRALPEYGLALSLGTNRNKGVRYPILALLVGITLAGPLLLAKLFVAKKQKTTKER